MKRVAASLCVLMLLLVACSSNELANQGERSRAGKDKRRTGSRDGKGRDGGGKGGAKSAAEQIEAAQESGRLGASGSEGSDGDASAPGDFGGADAPKSGVDPSLARASVAIADPATDAKSQGIPPRYTEVAEARIEGLGKRVRLTISYAAAVPERVGKEQYMVVAFGITGQKEGEGHGIGAVANEKGWEPYAGAKGENEKFPGSFRISGNEIVFEVPWSYINGPRAFEWYASSGWYGKIANQTHWAFDGVPNEEAGDFPG